MSKSDEISQHVVSRVQLTRERVKQILRELESVSDELNALYDYAMDHDMESIADEIGVIDFDLVGALFQVEEILKELQALEHEVMEDEQEEE